MKNIKKYLIRAIIGANTMMLLSCNLKDPKPLKFTKPNEQKLLTAGEWVSNTDSMYGISIRENKMAFFKNMQFSSKDIHEYELIDFIYKFSDREDKVGEYILSKDFKDTIYYQIINKSDNSLTLKVNKKTEMFKLKQKNTKG